MFLHRQRPSVAANCAEIVLKMDEVGQEFYQCRARAVVMGVLQERIGQQGKIAGPDFQAAADEKARHVEPAGLFDFLEEQPADEKAAENKKQIDAGPTETGQGDGDGAKDAGGFRGYKRVEKEDEQNRHAAQKIKLRHAILLGCVRGNHEGVSRELLGKCRACAGRRAAR